MTIGSLHIGNNDERDSAILDAMRIAMENEGDISICVIENILTYVENAMSEIE